jgi:hypothetical protein
MKTTDVAGLGIMGHVIAELWTPKQNLLAPGPKLRLKAYREQKNLVTDNGDQYYGDAGAALHANATVSAPNAVKGMNLSTQTTVAAKSGAGSYIVTGITGSGIAIGASYPQSSQPASARRITWQSVWGAGVATDSNINSVSICNPSGAIADSNAEADTIAYSVFSSAIDKQAGDTLTVTWHHDLLGA